MGLTFGGAFFGRLGRLDLHPEAFWFFIFNSFVY
jgi:hypothetical protein